MTNFLQEMLLIKSTDIETVMRAVKSFSYPLLTLSFISGAIYENIGKQDFLNLFKRLIIALFLISFGASLLKSTVHFSFEVSTKILTSVKSTSPIIQLIERAREISKKAHGSEAAEGFEDKSKEAIKGLWESQAFVSKLLFGDGISSVVFILSYGALLFLGQLYTIAYNFSYVTMPLLACLIVFPPTYSVASSINKTISWVFLMPIFTTITILLLSNSFSFPQDNQSTFYFTTLENLINFCIMALMLLFIPTVVSGILSGSGVLTAAETFTKTTVTAALSGGKGIAINALKSVGSKVVFGKNYGIATLSKMGIDKSLNKLGQKSIEARSRLNDTGKERNSTIGAISMSMTEQHTKNMTSNSVKESSNNDSKATNSILSRSFDRSIIAADSVLNVRKNHIASAAVKKDLSSNSKQNHHRSLKEERFNKYKAEAHRSYNNTRPIDYEVNRLRTNALNKTLTNLSPASRFEDKGHYRTRGTRK